MPVCEKVKSKKDIPNTDEYPSGFAFMNPKK